MSKSLPGVPELLHAIAFAADKHRDHRRKGQTGAPYINHPITVAEQLADHGHAENIALLMAAVLHDVIEDTETTEEELRTAFGARVAGIVLEVTDDKSLRKKERRAHTVRSMASKSHDARLLKLSDIIANLNDVIHHPPDWTQEQKLEYLDWAEQVAREGEGTDAGLEKRFRKLAGAARTAFGEGQ